jgi:hypothetical protein
VWMALRPSGEWKTKTSRPGSKQRGRSGWSSPTTTAPNR